MIEVRNLSVHRNGQGILHDLDWTVRSGEHWVILGANGSGKTSLLAALTGYLMPSGGHIRVLGKTYGETDWRELRKRIGLVSASLSKMVEPEETGLRLVASGREAIVNLWNPSTSDRTRARALLREIEAEHLADREWRVLSQGERQRLMIARALVARPPLLILDEPCAGLDPIAREHFLTFLDRLARRRGGPALVLVTHHVEEIVSAFSHILLLKEGAVVAQGSLPATLNSRNLSKTFSTPVRLSRSQGRYRLVVPGTVGQMF